MAVPTPPLEVPLPKGRPLSLPSKPGDPLTSSSSKVGPDVGFPDGYPENPDELPKNHYR